ncbi:MAG: glycosyltransferase family 4 protein [Planctomycetota bacterium]
MRDPGAGVSRNGSGRIGYLLRMYPRFSQTFVANEICELERQNVPISILSLRKPTDGYFHEAVSRVKARAHYLDETPHGRMPQLLRMQWDAWRSNPAGFREARRVVRQDKQCTRLDLCRAIEALRWAKKEKVDHVHVHFGTSEATVALAGHLIGGLSYSMTLHAFDIFRENVDRPLLAKKINHSRFTVTVSEFNKRFMVEHLPGVRAEKIRVAYNGVSLERFSPERNPDPTPTVFSLGRLIEKKGFIYLVRAIGLLRDEGLTVRCRIGGEGPDKKVLRDEIDRLKLKKLVELCGPLGEVEVREGMQRSTCFALPCVQAKDGNIDALPTVLLESLACACPTVTTRLSGNPEIVEDGASGLLVDPGDQRALAAAIRRMISDPPWAENLGRAGRRRAEERFDIRRNAGVMRNWLLEAAADSSLGEPQSVHDPAASPTAPLLCKAC